MRRCLADQYLNEGYIEALIADAPDLDDAAEAWAWYRAFAEVADRLSGLPMSQTVKGPS